MIRKYPPPPQHCLRCDKIFTPQWHGARHYCSATCRKAGPRLMTMKSFERVYPDRQCETCHMTYTPTNARQIYCRRSCRPIARYQRERRAARLAIDLAQGRLK